MMIRFQNAVNASLTVAVGCDFVQVKASWKSRSHEERNQVKEALLTSGVTSRLKPVRVALHVAVAYIADTCGLSDDWPQLLPFFGRALLPSQKAASPDELHAMACVLDCLCTMLDDGSSDVAKYLAPHMDGLLNLACQVCVRVIPNGYTTVR
jgi:hypothetical protein